jgi:hypothetical protein
MVDITLEFEGGAYLETQFPLKTHQQSGIYIVYAGTQTSAKLYSGRDILYIGESENVSLRLAPNEKPKKGLKHERYQDWVNNLLPGEVLLFSIADVDPSVRKQAEAALIYFHYNNCNLKLPCNEQNKKSFDYDEKTNIILSGDYMFLTSDFTVGEDITSLL